MKHWTEELFSQVLREHDEKMSWTEGRNNMGVDGGRPDKFLIDDLSKLERRERRGRGLVLILCCIGCFLFGYSMGLSKVERVSSEWAALTDQQQEIIRSLRADILEEIQVLQRDLGIKLVFPGELDQKSKLVLMRELNDLVLENYGEED